jgi:hypothetical protein
MKVSTYARRLSSINQLKPFFNGKKLRAIKTEDFHKWEVCIAGRYCLNLH